MRVIPSGKLLIIFSLAVVLIFLYMSMGVGFMLNYDNSHYINPEKDEEALKVKDEEVLKALEKKAEIIPELKYIEKKDEIISSTAKGEKKNDLKYILQWTSSRNVPFVYMGTGQQGFIERGCLHTNCFVTADRNYLGDYTKFDVIAFAGPEVVYMNENALPEKRSPHQKFVFATIESADNYPMCSNRLDGFFNWTWTYKLDSESKWGYIIVRDSEGKIIGPKKNMDWIKYEDMEPVSYDLKKIFRGKTKIAAWFVSNCISRSSRESFVEHLQEVLDNKYGKTVDIYGDCGPLKCSRKNETECDEMIEKDYYFYLAFENSFSEDYVTEKILHALEYSAIPIVFGGANYSRFLPERSYINARDLNVEQLASKMNELMNDIDKYSEYFRWRKYYSYRRRAASIETDDYCSQCALLNDEEKVKTKSVYEDFKKWWTPPGRC